MHRSTKVPSRSPPANSSVLIPDARTSSVSGAAGVDWPLVALLVVGGIAGTVPGQCAGRRLARHKHLLNAGFAVLVIGIGGYIVARGLMTLA